MRVILSIDFDIVHANKSEMLMQRDTEYWMQRHNIQYRSIKLYISIHTSVSKAVYINVNISKFSCELFAQDTHVNGRQFQSTATCNEDNHTLLWKSIENYLWFWWLRTMYHMLSADKFSNSRDHYWNPSNILVIFNLHHSPR